MCKNINAQNDKECLNNADLGDVSGGAGIRLKKNKCANWECKVCARKATDPFYVGGMHMESCYYRGIIGCKCCKHYIKGKACKYDSEANS